MTDKKPLSFGFTKRLESKKLTDSALREDSSKEKATVTDYLTHVQDKQIHGSVKYKKEELVIPMITTGAWASKIKKLEDKYNQEEGKETGDKEGEVEKDDGPQPELSLEERAAKELIEDSKSAQEKWENRDKVNANLTIAADVTDNQGAEESTMEDYDSVPIAEFGLACLKGMGWKPGQGIGKNNKGPISITDVQLRPKGLGLGANRNDLKVTNEEEELPMVRNAFVEVVGGNHKGSDGQVQGIDEDGARVVVKLSSTGDVVTISSSLLKVVKKLQLNVLNKEKYDKYKELQERQNSKSSRRESPEVRDRKEREHRKDRRERDHKDRDHYRDRDHHRDRDDYKDRSNHHREREDRVRDSPPDERSLHREESWVRSQLRVRIIDEKYLKGKYYNAKVEVVDVSSPTLCICRSQDGRVLDDVPTRKLETIVPKEANGTVMVLRGRYKGKMGQIIDRDRKKYLATVQLNSNRHVITLSYDDICEYLGGDY